MIGRNFSSALDNMVISAALCHNLAKHRKAYCAIPQSSHGRIGAKKLKNMNIDYKKKNTKG